MKISLRPLVKRLLGCGLPLFVLISPAHAAAPVYATPYAFSTLAGTPSIGSTDGTGIAAHFNTPYGVALDSAGNLYVADYWNRVIRKVTPAGATSTLAGAPGSYGSLDGSGANALFGNPAGIAVDGTGNIFVSDASFNHIRKITSGGLVTTFAGSASNAGSVDGTGPSARFNAPSGVAADSLGNVYVADAGNRTIRKITSAGVVTTLAGLAGSSDPSIDGNGAGARFTSLSGLAIDPTGNLYALDQNTVRKISPAGVVTTLAGLAGSTNSGGIDDGVGTVARFNTPNGITVDTAGNVYVADTLNNTIRKITPAGVVSTLAGLPGGVPPVPGSAGSVDGTGSAARFFYPQGVAADAAGNVYVADTRNNLLRKVTVAGVVTTLAGVSPFQSTGTTDGTGSIARFAAPHGAAVDAAGNLYIADTLNSTIRKISSTGLVSTFAGSAGLTGSTDAIGSAARFYYPYGIVVDGAGIVYVSDTFNQTIRKINPSGVVTTLAGAAGTPGNTNGSGSAARFDRPEGLAVDTAGNVYVADANNYTIRKITATGNVTTVAGIPGTAGIVDGPVASATLAGPEGVAVDSVGNIYVADTGSFAIRKITTTGVVSTFAGLTGSPGSIDGPAGTNRFNGPEGIAIDSAGNIYVADNSNSVVRGTSVAGFAVADAGNYTFRKITPAGVVSTVAGWERDSTDGSGSSARFDIPYGVAVDSAGRVYVTCSSPDSNTIRRGQAPGSPVITSQPQSLTVAPGASAVFSVVVNAAPAPTYQWFFNGTSITGATSASYTVTNAQSSNAGNYTVTVTNSLGSVTSNPANLAVSSGGNGNAGGGNGSGSSSGGGAIEGWFMAALAALAGARLKRNR
ncbi:MAG: immunoglobulin domain-containing protein [Opitutaceae bacterium]